VHVATAESAQRRHMLNGTLSLRWVPWASNLPHCGPRLVLVNRTCNIFKAFLRSRSTGESPCARRDSDSGTARGDVGHPRNEWNSANLAGVVRTADWTLVCWRRLPFGHVWAQSAVRSQAVRRKPGAFLAISHGEVVY